MQTQRTYNAQPAIAAPSLTADSPIVFLRIKHILGNPKKGIPAIIPVSPATWWAGVKSGRFPKGIKLSENVTVWRSDTIYKLLNDLNTDAK